MQEHRQAQRHEIRVERQCALGVVTFKELAWSDHLARVVDLSRNGVGIESASRIEPGFVLFRDRVGGHKSGILMWSKQNQDRYRAGIRFVPLTHDEEVYLQGESPFPSRRKPGRSPQEIAGTLMHYLTRDRGAPRTGGTH